MTQRTIWYSFLFTFALCIGGTDTSSADRLQAAPAVQGQGDGLPEPPKASPMREQCETALRGDAEWNARFKASIRPEVHKEETGRMLNNNKHVVMAYAVIWIFSIGFLLMMWLRQQRLAKEISRLESELSRVLSAEKNG